MDQCLHLVERCTTVRGLRGATYLGQPQIGVELSALQPERGIGWAAGVTNGNDNHLNSTASKDLYLHLSQGSDCTISACSSSTARTSSATGCTIGPCESVPTWTSTAGVPSPRPISAAYEADPTRRSQGLWYYGGFLERSIVSLRLFLSLLRVDYAWTPRLMTERRGTTHVQRRLWEITGGWQWLILQNLKLVAEVTYGRTTRRNTTIR